MIRYTVYLSRDDSWRTPRAYKNLRSTNCRRSSPSRRFGGRSSSPCSGRCSASTIDRPSDQNAGILAWAVATALAVPAMIVTNAESDPNKSLESEYSKIVASRRPHYLLEVYSHGGKNAWFDIEVSSGSLARQPYAKRFGGALEEEIAAEPELCRLTKSADFRKLFFKAAGTATMFTGR